MKFADIKNHPVISVTDASRLGFVDTLLLDLERQQVVGLRVRRGGLITHHEACLLSDVQAFGTDAVTVQDASRLNEQGKFSQLQGAADFGAIAGARILDEAGNAVGSAADIDFDPTSGSIQRYVLSPGLLDRIKRDEHTISVNDVRSASPGMIVVTSSSVANEGQPSA